MASQSPDSASVRCFPPDAVRFAVEDVADGSAINTSATRWITRAAMILCLLGPVQGQTAERTWRTAEGGAWSDPENWSRARVPNAAEDVARFNKAPVRDVSISIDQPITIGQLLYQPPVNTTFTGSGPLILDNANEPASIEALARQSGYVNVNVPVLLRTDLNVINRSGTRMDFSGGLRSADGVEADLHLRAERRGGFQLLGGVELSGNLSVFGSEGSFFAGPLQFQSLLLEDAKATFESAFSTDQVTIGQDSLLVVEQPSTVRQLHLGGGRVEGIHQLHVTESTVARDGVVDFTGQPNLFGSPLIKRGSGQLSLLNVSNDLQQDILVHDGLLLLEYPDPNAIGADQGAGVLRLAGPEARVSISGDFQAVPLHFPINLNNVRPARRFDTALSGRGRLAGPIHLGEVGAKIGGGFQVTGPLSGGSLLLAGDLELLSGVHTYTGETVVMGGELRLSDQAELTTTSAVVLRGGDLRLAPDTLAQRIAPDIPVVMERGRLSIPTAGPISQELGELRVTGRGFISTESSLQVQTLHVAEDAALHVNTNFEAGAVFVEELVRSDLLPTNIRHQGEFARYIPEVGIIPLRPEVELETDQWNESTHAAVGRRVQLSANAQVRTLTMLPDTQERQLTLRDEVALNVISGGVRFPERGRINGASGRLTAGGEEDGFLYLISDAELQIDARITDNAGPDGDFSTSDDNGSVGLLADGSVVLTGQNSYSGPTVVLRDLQYGRPSAISPNSDVVLRGGGVRLDFEGVAQFKSLTLEGSSSVGGDNAVVHADLITLKSGNFNTAVSGATNVIKDTVARSNMDIDSKFRGAIHVREGTLDLRFFQPPGAEFRDHQARVEISAGARLNLDSPAMNGIFEGNGSINYLTTGDGSIIRPGIADTVGELTVGEIQVRDGGTYEWQLADANGNPGESWDHLQLGSLFTRDSSEPWVLKIATVETAQPLNFDNRRVFSWELAEIARPDEHLLDFNKVAIDATALLPSNPLPDAFSLALRGNSWLLEYGVEADINGDLVIDGSDLDAACANGRALGKLVRDQFGTHLGDFDLDGTVGFEDFVVMALHYGSDGGWSAGDATCDQQVNFADFIVLSQNFGATQAIANVPEPAMPAAWLLFLVLVPRRTRHHRVVHARRTSTQSQSCC